MAFYYANAWLSSSISAIIIVVYLGSTSSAFVTSNETDFYALLGFKVQIIDDPFGVLSSWNHTTPFCQWPGVMCGRRHRRVTVLELPSLMLVGSIAPSIGNLSFLRILNLQNNSFGHEIPQEIGRLRRLERLDLRNNSIGGQIPDNISSCLNLMGIQVSRNQLVGYIPSEIGNLLKMRYLHLHDNRLTGKIPPSIGNLSQLVALSLLYNNLVGTIPDTIGDYVNLIAVGIGGNMLSGIIPPSFFNLSSAEILYISENNFQGSLPSDLGISLPSIRHFSAALNNFSGTIPASFSNASNIWVLEFAVNELTGLVPSLKNLPSLQWLSLSSNYLGSGDIHDLRFLHSIANTTGLQMLAINKNNFGGVLPEIISNFSDLNDLWLSSNHISGSIPLGIENLVNLGTLHLSNNRLAGIIPSNIVKLKQLHEIDLSMNWFSGYIPSSLGNLTNLIRLRASSNNFEGEIPVSIGSCRNLLLLDLSRNNLSDSIPAELLNLSSLSIFLDLSHNQLTGYLPVEVGNLKSLGKFDVSDNMLSGKIPSTLGGCTSLEELHMQGNRFQGLIPPSLSQLKALQVLDLSHNNLSGEIPEFLSSFFLLKYLNLSYNNFEGPVPTKGVFTNGSTTWLQGNSKLCGRMAEFHLPPCVLPRPGKRRTLAMKLVIAVVSPLIGLTLLLFVLLRFFLRRKKREGPNSNFPLINALELSYHSLYKATDGFSSANMIGIGGFGSVFKGVLDRGQTLIAVKVFDLTRHGAFKSFMAECEALRSIRHRNLVKVMTACSGVDYKGNDFKALVYEFMANGSLEEWLHSPGNTDETDLAPRKLSIMQRLNIAIDVACAIEYLHHHCETPIIHCDLKPSNILLVEDMTAHVGDFGLAKFYHESSHGDNLNQSTSVGIKGTVGYASPEYGIGNEESTNGDVYSYGIILLEIFTGKRPINGTFNEDFNLHTYVKTALPERMLEILDPCLLREVAEGERMTSRFNKTVESLILVFGIGVACSVESPGERISITSVVNQLVSIKNKLPRN